MSDKHFAYKNGDFFDFLMGICPEWHYGIFWIFKKMSRKMDEATKTQLEAAAFRRMVEHFRERTDVQNIDMMNLAGFCRNCLSKWYQEAANAEGIEMDKLEAREIIYGMPFDAWKEKYQTEASPEQRDAFEKSHKHD